MANVIVNESSLQDIADAIRLKLNTQDTYKPSEMSGAIDAISGGGITPTGTKQISITQNGTTTEDVTNYANAEITANVPNSYSAGDEGKVVSNGALVAQTSDTVTENDTYDTTLINSLTVNVPSSGSGYTTGAFTPNSRTGSVTIDTGLSTLHGLVIYPTSESPYKSRGRTVNTFVVLPNSEYLKALVCFSNTAGSAKDTFSLWTSNPPFSISGTSITISPSYPENTGYFETVSYTWYAW